MGLCCSVFPEFVGAAKTVDFHLSGFAALPLRLMGVSARVRRAGQLPQQILAVPQFR